MKLKHIKIQNYKGLGELILKDIPHNLSFVYGIHGTGKTRLIDTIAFIQDCLVTDLKTAISKRGGIEDVFGNNQFIRFDLVFDNLISYQLDIGFDTKNGVFIREESIGCNINGKSYYILYHSFSGIEFIVNEFDMINYSYAPVFNTNPYPFDDLALKFNINDSLDTIGSIRQFLLGIQIIDTSKFDSSLITEKNFKQLCTQLSDKFDYMLMYPIDYHFDRILKYMSIGELNLFFNMLVLDLKNKSMIVIDTPEANINSDFLFELAFEYLQYANTSGSQLLITTRSKFMLDAIDITQSYLIENDITLYPCVTKLCNIKPVTNRYNKGTPLSKIHF